MSGQIDPATGKELPSDAIQRVLFICHPVHVYAIPPLTSMKGYAAADWTVPDPKNNNQTRQIFTARLRIIETAITLPSPPQPQSQPRTQIQSRPGIPSPTTTAAPAASPQEKVKVDIVLEDPSTGNLFAAAPYTDPGAVEHAIDSSRFFAIRVMNDGRKAILGIGFEDRSEAFDFGVTLQEARKVLGLEQSEQTLSPGPGTGRAAAKTGRTLGSGNLQKPAPGNPAQQAPRDYSLKPGQTISINIGGKKPSTPEMLVSPATAAREEQTALFSIPPPPAPPSRGDEDGGGDGDSSAAAFPMIAPPPAGGRSDRRRRPQSMLNMEENKVVQGFSDNDDDGGGDFGEFQS
ncbi:hypothetical protein GX51_07498 [Blastomyces parvus]|uniref:NECAP PHear domain-containing protein n=1 Tax=Blastomyces parvus TaxID=2060905 RepID=A0A2B7WKR2_9EURO|nr:hypothetical protein GX51_07498 [Blastomyces parvus]